jgi:hypothetical protein
MCVYVCVCVCILEADNSICYILIDSALFLMFTSQDSLLENNLKNTGLMTQIPTYLIIVIINFMLVDE